jgi:hypothetical protein
MGMGRRILRSEDETEILPKGDEGRRRGNDNALKGKCRRDYISEGETEMLPLELPRVEPLVIRKQENGME